MSNKLKGFTFGEIGIAIIFIIIILLTIFFAIDDKRTTGCWTPEQQDKEIHLPVNYTCEQLEKMISLRIYPDNNMTRTDTYCHDKLISSKITDFYYLNDYKNLYIEQCMKEAKK